MDTDASTPPLLDVGITAQISGCLHGVVRREGAPVRIDLVDPGHGALRTTRVEALLVPGHLAFSSVDPEVPDCIALQTDRSGIATFRSSDAR